MKSADSHQFYHDGIRLGIYAEKLSLRLISTLISILKKRNIYGTWSLSVNHIESSLNLIITTEHCKLMQISHLTETLTTI